MSIVAFPVWLLYLFSEFCYLDNSKILFVPGKEWRRHGSVPELLEPMNLPVPAVVISYTMKDPCFDHQECLREIKWTHKCHLFGSKLGDIRYNFLIGGDAAVYEGRGWKIRPSIPEKFQFIFDDCLYIAFMGRFKDEPPGEKMMEALKWLLRFGVENKYLSRYYMELSLESSLPDTGFGRRVQSVEYFMKGDGMENNEAHEDING